MSKNRAFAEKLQAVIDQDENLTVAGLAVKAGLDNSTIRQLLSGKIETPTLRTANKICEALGTTYEVFMSNAQTPAEKEIVRLVMLLPDDLRQKLISYGQGLLAASDQGNQESEAIDKSTNHHNP